jgi:hypothetical protein
MKTQGEYLELEIWAQMALQLAPKWSPYRLLWKFTIWYARRKQRVLR